MNKADIHPGKEYAVREPVGAGGDFQHVRVIEPVRRSHWRVEWIDPNPGLVDFLKSANFIVPWGERRAFLRDEQRAEALALATARTFPGDDSPIGRAVESVLECTGELNLHLYKGSLSFEREPLERVATRVGIDPPSHPTGYKDRHGREHLPFSCALTLAEAFAAAEPRTVLDSVDADEREWSLQLREPGSSHLSRLLSEYRAAWALVRQWAGHDVAVAVREERITELERLLTQVQWDLRRPSVDLERVADRIERALRRG